MSLRLLNYCVLVLILFQSTFDHAIASDGAPEESSPRFGYQDVDCWFSLGLEQSDDRPITCGQLTVPENWNVPETKAINLPIVRFGARNSNATGEPIIFLLGGPIQRPMLRDEESIRSFWIDMLRQHVWADNHDLIVVTPRGANWTDSNLECPELYDPRVSLGASGQERGRVHWLTTYAPAYIYCIERLKLAHDLRGYTLDHMVSDVLALREELQLDSWSLMGVSFGTRLALEVMRGVPAGLQKVVLDSVMPPGANPVRDVVTGIGGAFKKLVAACAGDPFCHREYPDLEMLPQAAIEYLEAGYYIGMSDTKSFGTVYFDLGPTDVWTVLLEKLVAPDLVGEAPSLLAEMAAGNHQPIRDMHWQQTQPPFPLTNAAFDLMNCNLYNDDLDETDWGKMKAEFPLYSYLIDDLKEYLSLCSEWPTTKQSAEEEASVTSAVPTLLLAGEFDASTPPEHAEKVAETLGNSYVFILENQAHSVLISSRCAAAITTAFLKDSAVRPEVDCSLLDRKIAFKPRIRRENGG